VLAGNQGLYNGFLAAGLLWALVTYGVVAGRPILSFFLLCVIAAASTVLHREQANPIRAGRPGCGGPGPGLALALKGRQVDFQQVRPAGYLAPTSPAALRSSGSPILYAAMCCGKSSDAIKRCTRSAGSPPVACARERDASGMWRWK